MANARAPIPVSAGELLMRRVPGSSNFFNPQRPAESPLGVTLLVFKPTGADADGLSVSRMQSSSHPNFLTLEAFAARACAGKPPEKYYYIAILSAAELLDSAGLDLELKPDPQDGDEGHTLIPHLNATLDKPMRNRLMLMLAREYCQRVVGPFNCNGRVAAVAIDWTRPSAGHA